MFGTNKMIRIKRRLGLSSDNRTDINAVNNVFVDFYLNGFKRRRQHKESKWMVIFNYFTVLCQVVCLVKFAVGLAIPLSHDIKLVIYDISTFFGGIETYNKISFMALKVIMIATILELRVRDRECSSEWTQVFEIARNKVLLKLMYKSGNGDVLVKLIPFMNRLYKLLTATVVSSGKFITMLVQRKGKRLKMETLIDLNFRPDLHFNGDRSHVLQ